MPLIYFIVDVDGWEGAQSNSTLPSPRLSLTYREITGIGTVSPNERIDISFSPSRLYSVKATPISLVFFYIWKKRIVTLFLSFSQYVNLFFFLQTHNLLTSLWGLFCTRVENLWFLICNPPFSLTVLFNNSIFKLVVHNNNQYFFLSLCFDKFSRLGS